MDSKGTPLLLINLGSGVAIAPNSANQNRETFKADLLNIAEPKQGLNQKDY